MDEPIPSLPHPFAAMTKPECDLWIDRFRSAFFANEDAGLRVLMFLAKHWHFYSRSLWTREACVQRQCFIDLLTCLGVWQEDIEDQVLLGLLRQPEEPASVTARFRAWFRRWRDLRTRGSPVVKEAKRL